MFDIRKKVDFDKDYKSPSCFLDNTPCENLDKSYCPSVEEQVNRMLVAGEKLAQIRSQQYDETSDNPDDYDEEIFDNVRTPEPQAIQKVSEYLSEKSNKKKKSAHSLKEQVESVPVPGKKESETPLSDEAVKKQ